MNKAEVANPAGGVAFIGAMNRDLVFMGPAPAEVQRDLEMEDLHYEPYRENVIPDELADVILRSVAGRGDQLDQLGGSAFNVARSLRQIDPNVRLGFVGVAGTVGGSRPHLDFLVRHHIESVFVATLDQPAATSLSFVSDGDRTLLTTIAVNNAFPEHLRTHLQSLVEYLSGFEIVHVSSLLDNRSADILAILFQAMHSRGATTLISVDPGTAWVKRLDGGVRRLVEQTDLLHLNSDEFDTLAGRLSSESVSQAAGRVLALMKTGGQLLARSSGTAALFEAVGGHGRPVASVRNHVFSNERVVDSTGAGDTFIAGFLAAHFVRRIQLGLQLGLAAALAGRKVTQRGPLARQDCEEVLTRFGPGPATLGEGQATPVGYERGTGATDKANRAENPRG